jgi:hypothetical protein
MRYNKEMNNIFTPAEQSEPDRTVWSLASPYVLMVFLLLSSATLYFYLRAMWGGPGAVPANWAPVGYAPWRGALVDYASVWPIQSLMIHLLQTLKFQ